MTILKKYYITYKHFLQLPLLSFNTFYDIISFRTLKKEIKKEIVKQSHFLIDNIFIINIHK